MPGRKKEGNFFTFLLVVFGAAVVILLVVLLGGKGQPTAPGEVPVIDKQLEQLQTQSTSDEILLIEKDLQNTNLDQIDAELKEVGSSLQDL